MSKASFMGRCIAAALLVTVGSVGHTQETVEGFLCCSLGAEGGWISDINLRGGSDRVLKVGTPVKVLGFGRQRVKLSVDGKVLELGNDYSRALDLVTFRDRYVLPMDPLEVLRQAPEEVQALVEKRQAAPGMDRRYVSMALGYPVVQYTPNLSDKRWTYFYTDEERRFWVLFNDAGVVESIQGDADILHVVAPAMLTPERKAQASKGEPPCQINVYYGRVQHWNESREKVIIYLDDREKGTLTPGEALCFNNLAPGSHTVSTRATHMLLPSLFKGPEVIVQINAEAPPSFFRYQKVMTGMIVGGPVAVPQSQQQFDAVSEEQWRARQ